MDLLQALHSNDTYKSILFLEQRLQSKLLDRLKEEKKRIVSKVFCIDESQYNYCSTQINIDPTSFLGEAIAHLRNQVKASDLRGDGKELHPHVTVRYGLEGANFDSIRTFLSDQKPFSIVFGATDCFSPSQSSDDAVPIFVAVYSNALKQLNSEIAHYGSFKPSTFNKYCPHLTLAYVSKESAEQYVGKYDLAGMSFLVKNIAITSKDGAQEEMELLGGLR